MEAKGYRVLLAEDGHVALDLRGKYKDEIMISDLVMPRLGGQLLVEAFSAQHRNYRSSSPADTRPSPAPAAAASFTDIRFIQKRCVWPDLLAQIRALIEVYRK